MTAALVSGVGPTTGCIELLTALQGAPAGGDSADPGRPDGDPGQPDDGTDDANGPVPAVALSVSNPTPQVNEDVRFTCSVTSGANGAVEFDFSANIDRLIVDGRLQLAVLVDPEVLVDRPAFVVSKKKLA